MVPILCVSLNCTALACPLPRLRCTRKDQTSHFTTTPRRRSAQEDISLSVGSSAASHSQEPAPSYLPWWEAAQTNRSSVQRPLPFWAERRDTGERGVPQVPRIAPMCSGPELSPGAAGAPVGQSTASTPPGGLPAEGKSKRCPRKAQGVPRSLER